MRNYTIVIIYSRSVLQPPGIRRFGNGVSKLPPLRPVLGNGDPFTEFLRNALTFECVFQCPAPSHPWTANWSRTQARMLPSQVLWAPDMKPSATPYSRAIWFLWEYSVLFLPFLLLALYFWPAEAFVKIWPWTSVLNSVRAWVQNVQKYVLIRLHTTV